jgi:signal transduction histidine kinase
MWKKLSLRGRLLLPMAAMIVGALLLGGLALQIVSPEQFRSENAQGARASQNVAAALNAGLAAARNPQDVLEAFGGRLGTGGAVAFLPGDAAPPHLPARMHDTHIPAWFTTLLQVPELGAIYPITIGARHVGDIVFDPDLSADVFEKWVGFLAIVASGSLLMVLAGMSAYLTTGAALQPLAQLGAGLTRMRNGNYDTMIPVAGPPEIKRSCEEANQLASTLGRLSRDNVALLRKIVSVADEERSELARELHDELGPLLFAIRANATALSESQSGAEPEPGSPAQRLLGAAEALYQIHRRILEGLSPLYVGDLGLDASIRTLLRNAQAQLPAINLTFSLDPRLDELDGLLSQTIYRVIQEATTNVLRHAQASNVDVVVRIGSSEVEVEICDDGKGVPPERPFGRGLTGMNERVRALNGTFELVSEYGRTVIRCRLPLELYADR